MPVVDTNCVVVAVVDVDDVHVDVVLVLEAGTGWYGS